MLIFAVTPLVGVWIEIIVDAIRQQKADVTPLVGVWIEMILSGFMLGWTLVTPLVGVWIEIYLVAHFVASMPSLPLWECGLK